MSRRLFISDGTQQTGPYDESQIQSFIQSGHILAHSLCWEEGMATWTPISQVMPHLFQAAPAPSQQDFQQTVMERPQPQAAPQQPVSSGAAPYAGGGTTSFEILDEGYYKMPKLNLSQAEVIVESGAMHYMQGEIEIEAKVPSVGGMLKAKLTKEKVVRPRYRGTGTIFLEPTFGEVNLMELKGEEWILDKGAFLACDPGIAVGMFTNKAMSGFFGGEGFFQTSVSGHGKLLFHSKGPLKTIHLNNETLTVDGSFAVARTAGLDFRPEKATGKMFSSWVSGEGIVNRFRGTGTVLIAPIPNRFLTMMREFGGLHWAIRRIPRG